MSHPHKLRVFTRLWINETTNVQMSAKTAIFMKDVDNVEEYKYDKVKSDKPLIYLMTYSQTILVQGDFNEICEEVNKAKEIDYLDSIQHFKN